LFIIIDELDRCRPSFALEVIEKIKHIFQLERIKFILVLNDKILESMIEKEYNLKNEGHRYLQKFVQKRIPYDPNTNLDQYIKNALKDNREPVRETVLHKYLSHEIVMNLKNKFGINLRDFTTLFSNFKTYNKYSTEMEGIIIFALEILRLIDKENYSSLENHIILNDFQVQDNQFISLLNKIVSSFKKPIKTEEVIEFSLNYFQHEYN
jgi:predicted KAP-like P-loop ATPase